MEARRKHLKLCCENFREKFSEEDDLCGIPIGIPDSRRSWITSEIQALEDFHPRVIDILRVFHYVSWIYDDLCNLCNLCTLSDYIQSETGHFRYLFL